jgi:hypothetical protein
MPPADRSVVAVLDIPFLAAAKGPVHARLAAGDERERLWQH